MSEPGSLLVMTEGFAPIQGYTREPLSLDQVRERLEKMEKDADRIRGYIDHLRKLRAALEEREK